MGSTVLDLLRDRLMQPEAVAAFIKAYATEANTLLGGAAADRGRLHSERATLVRKLDGLYDAIADGLRTPGLKGKLEEIEARVAQVDQELEAPEPSQVRFHPNLSELYRHKVVELAATLSDPDIRTQAIETIRSLIETVTVSIDEEQVCLEFEGAIAKMIGVAQNAKSPLCSGLSVDIINRSVQVVAGVGFEPTTFRL
jgi:site-specific DNA recombinase